MAKTRGGEITGRGIGIRWRNGRGSLVHRTKYQRLARNSFVQIPVSVSSPQTQINGRGRRCFKERFRLGNRTVYVGFIRYDENVEETNIDKDCKMDGIAGREDEENVEVENTNREEDGVDILDGMDCENSDREKDVVDSENV